MPANTENRGRKIEITYERSEREIAKDKMKKTKVRRGWSF